LASLGLSTGYALDQALAIGQKEAAAAVLRLAFDVPGLVLDLSPHFGHAYSLLARVIRRGGGRQAFLATRLSAPPGAEAERQLRRQERDFGRGRVDLVQIEDLADWQAGLAQLREWKAQGRIRYIGLTHRHHDAFPALERILAREAVDFLQIPYSVAEPEAERRLLPLAAKRGVAVIAQRPLAGGFLARQARERPLPSWAAGLGCRDWRSLFLKYVLAHPAVTCALLDTADARTFQGDLAAARGRLPGAARRAALRKQVQGWG
jgi:aryl-alcohol dehydrogenase-like predicted oxidoreductase